jgi:hypothetical protein
MKRHRPIRRLFAAGLAISLIAATTTVLAGPIAEARFDAPGAFSVTYMHGPIDADAAHPLAGGAAWVTGGAIAEDAGTFWDSIDITGTAQHVIPPHGEGPNANIYGYAKSGGFRFQATGAYIDAAPAAVSFAHLHHTNEYDASLSYTVVRSWGLSDITGYTHVVWGKHTDYPCERRYAQLVSDQMVPAGTSVRSGVAMMRITPSMATIDLVLAIPQIVPIEIIALELRSGAPGMQGGLITTLATGGMFQSVQGMGSSLTLLDFSIPVGVVPMLQAGQAYLQLRTAPNPIGELRGQIVAGPAHLQLQPVLDAYFGDPGTQDIEVTLSKNGQIVEGQTARMQNGTLVYQTMRRGVYDVSVKGSHWLRKALRGVLITDQGLLWQPTLTNGDVDGDNEVTIGDFGRLSAAFGSTEGEQGWDADADLDGDGEVTIGDYAILSTAFGQVGDDL